MPLGVIVREAAELTLVLVKIQLASNPRDGILQDTQWTDDGAIDAAEEPGDDQ